MKARVASALVALVVLVGLAGCGTTSDDDAPRTEVSLPTVQSAKEAALEKYGPDGYDGANGDGSLVWQFIPFKSSEQEPCPYGMGCVEYKVLAPNGCSDAYLKLNFLDAAGTVLGWSNDTATLGPGQAAVMKFVDTSGVSEPGQGPGRRGEMHVTVSASATTGRTR
ncbi:MAG: hypothetical protein NVV66_16455 [Cellulomonas sp.]|uniref:hypothetical protein n=1 Tax=Cellulomonas sp. TaxID=40001 RepID=UPI002590EF1E|nr:hypothetical protein [Cellulomonas sp.]MCR6706207.1 hypothetical protein [Cellulomonas sp.]